MHKEEAYLVPPPSPSATGGTQLHFEDEDGPEFEEEPLTSVAPLEQTRGRGVRGKKRKNKKNPPPA